ncbi:MAG: histidine triad nucleotide-binding protein [candidate division KSB1 bacterium]|nr:histidine triad nucleotide-binding protein [candidate division KSB1 bacterium]
MECVFCNILRGQLPAEFVYENERVVAFRDINPQAPVHVLIVPRKHIASTNEVRPEDQQLLGEMILVAQKVAQAEGIAQSGYRLVINCNEDSGQEIYHLHLHLLGGRRMTWPPG